MGGGGKYCAVQGCSQSSRRDKNRRFFRFPSDETRCRYWTKAIGRLDLNMKSINTLHSSYCVCDLHFAVSDCTKKFLRADAVPTLQLPQIEDLSGTSKYTQTDVYLMCYPSTLLSEDDGEATVPEGNNGHQKGYRCNVCRSEIVGFRYACVQCIDFDLCVACEADSKHAAHYMLRVPASKPDLEARTIIEMIRDQLVKERIERRIKVENQEENNLVEKLDPLVTNDDACVPPQDTSCQNIPYEDSKNLLTVKYLGLMKETNQPVFRVESHLPKAQSYQPIAHSQLPKAQPRRPKAQFHQVKAQFQDPPVTCPQKRPLTLEGSETESAFLWKVPKRGEMEGGEGESVGEEGCFTTFTHRAPAKVRPSSEESAPTSKKRKT